MSNVSSTVLLKPLIVGLFIAQAQSSAKAVWGDGGCDGEGVPLPIDPSQTALHHQLLEKTIPAIDIVEDDDGNVRITGRLEMDELVGMTISEFGIKIDGSLVGIRNSTPKLKQDDEEFETTITFVF